jgi:hypothetical protein
VESELDSEAFIFRELFMLGIKASRGWLSEVELLNYEIGEVDPGSCNK